MRRTAVRANVDQRNGAKVATAIDRLKNNAAADARARVAKELGVQVNELGGDITKAINDSVDRQFKAKIENRGVNSAVNSALTKDALGPALGRLNQVQDATLAMPELGDALKKNAELLFKTFRAFVDAGFNKEQAFQIILTQLQRR
jgi:hypothetical protein